MTNAMHTPALLQFLAELHDNNTKSWFLHNKPHYDILRDEFIALVADVSNRLQQFDAELGPVDAKKALFRIYRDVRFTKDKAPFKNHIGAVIGARTTDKTKPVYYFHIDHQGTLLVACGLYSPDKDVHKNIRDALVAQPKKFNAAINNTKFIDVYGALSDEDRMTRPPKGYAADLPLIDYIKNRHFICVTSINLAKKPPKNIALWIATQCEAAYPLVKWLRGAATASKT
jgi:uncharacterized protein (TIGR02453 family)